MNPSSTEGNAQARPTQGPGKNAAQALNPSTASTGVPHPTGDVRGHVTPPPPAAGRAFDRFRQDQKFHGFGGRGHGGGGGAGSFLRLHKKHGRGQ